MLNEVLCPVALPAIWLIEWHMGDVRGGVFTVVARVNKYRVFGQTGSSSVTHVRVRTSVGDAKRTGSSSCLEQELGSALT